MATQGKEVWKVVVRNHKFFSDECEKYVFAKSAAEAEKRALSVLDEFEKLGKPYVQSCEFHCYVY